jgi:deoxyribonuclease-4
MSIAGGVDKAVARAVRAGCEALQIFVKSSNQWAARPLAADEIERFRSAVSAAHLDPVICHDSYLINVGSPDDVLWEKSSRALEDEYRRCTQLGIKYLVMHPGAHVGSGEDAAFERIARAIDRVLAAIPDSEVEILIENTAGQGTNVGWQFEHLAAILGRLRAGERVGVCLDTCHTFAAGYEPRGAEAFEATISSFDRIVGWQRIKALHVNDSKKGCGSRVDRHEQIGEGQLGIEPFWRLMNDARFDRLVGSLETEYSDDGFENEGNLAVLRALVGRPQPPDREQLSTLRAQAIAAARARGDAS